MLTVACLECGAQIGLDEGVIRGEILQCPDCLVELEVLSVRPLDVGLAPEVEEDWGE